MGINTHILKSLRLKRNLSLQKLADELNKTYNLSITKCSLSRWESGKVVPLYSNLKFLAMYYNVTTDYLLGFDDDENEDFLDNDNNSQILKNKRNIKKSKEITSLVDYLKKDIFSPQDIKDIYDYSQYIEFKNIRNQ